MNKETNLIAEYIHKSGHYTSKLEELKKKYNNIKDFQVMLGYMVMEIVSQEQKFVNLKRKNIDLPLLTQQYF